MNPRYGGSFLKAFIFAIVSDMCEKYVDLVYKFEIIYAMHTRVATEITTT